ncbi:hypothetical protein BpHYR1_024403 [Brachionus plicatilis]|uniref:Uncharacterized protein n=1 Tax=Brachionus plicatilis TaxID=10195 RepID=A0A3M7QWX8_BRAPC|nr:hypothetical protein BpHYR1_024403 [Brachionus plicatilis]
MLLDSRQFLLSLRDFLSICLAKTKSETWERISDFCLNELADIMLSNSSTSLALSWQSYTQIFLLGFATRLFKFDKSADSQIFILVDLLYNKKNTNYGHIRINNSI